MDHTPEVSDGRNPSHPSSNYRYVVLGVLMLVYAFSFLDRQIVSILATSIKADLRLTDSQLGLVGGFAFAVFYTVLGIPVARLSDAVSRPKLIGAALATWSLFTALCGAAGSFASLLIARMGVGVGEAGGVVPSFSLLSDYFPPHQRGRVMGFFMVGSPIGAAIGLFAGGYLAASYGWRMSMVLVGTAGLLLTPILLMTVKEINRGGFDDKPKADAKPSIREVVGELPAAFWVVCIAEGFAGMMSYGLGFWLPVFLQRSLRFSLTDTSLILSIATIVGGVLSLIGAGMIADRFGHRNTGNYARVPAFSSLATLACVLITFGTSNSYFIYPALFGIYLFYQSYGPPSLALVVNISPPSTRATATALNLLIFNVMGLGIGPWLFGAASEAFTPAYGEEGLRYGILTCALVLYTCSIVMFFKAGAMLTARQRFAEAAIS